MNQGRDRAGTCSLKSSQKNTKGKKKKQREKGKEEIEIRYKMFVQNG